MRKPERGLSQKLAPEVHEERRIVLFDVVSKCQMEGCELTPKFNLQQGSTANTTRKPCNKSISIKPYQKNYINFYSQLTDSTLSSFM